MSRLNNCFLKLKQIKKTAFIPFITAGHPSLELSYLLLDTLVKCGADIIELGIPFSDPQADGVVIQKAHERAVKLGISLNDVLSLVSKFREKNKTTPIVLMGYANPVFKLGYENFSKLAKKAGIDGVLVVDMPPEEAHSLKVILDNYAIDLIFLVAPTTKDKRLALIKTQASGFVYFVSLKGVTGAKLPDMQKVRIQANHIKKQLNLPIGVGFGIKDANSAKMLSQVADGIIIGSAITSLIEKYRQNQDKMLAEVAYFAQGIHEAILKGQD